MGDQTKAEALRIARERLKGGGWKHGPDDVGRYAAEILNALYANLANKTDKD